LKKRKIILIILGICLLIGIIGCGYSKSAENEVVVSEPYSIRLYFEKSILENCWKCVFLKQIQKDNLIGW